MRPWAVSERTYEGFPLFVRRATNADTADNRRLFPHLLTITHSFAKRLPDGLPEQEYNRSLEDMDGCILSAFDAPLCGVPVLVETFGGKRHYYFYVASESDLAAIIDPIITSYPKEQLVWEVHPNNNWRFLDRYTEDFF